MPLDPLVVTAIKTASDTKTCYLIGDALRLYLQYHITGTFVFYVATGFFKKDSNAPSDITEYEIIKILKILTIFQTLLTKTKSLDLAKPWIFFLSQILMFLGNPNYLVS